MVMLITEYTTDGRTIVRFRKDWNPSRISKGYVAPLKNYVESKDACKLQRALLSYPITNKRKA